MRNQIRFKSIEAILVTLWQLRKWFYMLWKLWKLASWKTNQNLRSLQRKYLWQSFTILKPFFAIHNNFTYNSKLMMLWTFILKLCLKSWSLLFSSWIAWAELWCAYWPQWHQKISTELPLAQSSKGALHRLNHTTPPSPSPRQV